MSARRVFEGVVDVYDKHYGPQQVFLRNDDGEGLPTCDFDWFGYPEQNPQGKRVRITVEVLDDEPATQPAATGTADGGGDGEQG